MNKATSYGQYKQELNRLIKLEGDLLTEAQQHREAGRPATAAVSEHHAKQALEQLGKWITRHSVCYAELVETST